MRLTLANSATDGLNRPLGSMALDAYLRTVPTLRGHTDTTRVEVAYPVPWWNPRPFADDVIERVLASAPDVLGLSLLCWDREAQLALASRVKAERPATRVVVGGPSATGAGADLLAAHPAIDALVSGEGEAPLAALLERWLTGGAPDGIPGVSWRDADGHIHDGGGPGAPLPLDALPSLLGSGVYVPRWLVNLEFARGCAQRCRFCAWSRRLGGWRTAPEDRMRADIAAACRHEVTTALVLDSALNADEAHLERLVGAVQTGDPEGRLGLHGFVDLRTFTPGVAALLGRLRLTGVEVSLNSTTPAALKQAGRAPIDEGVFESELDRLAAVSPTNLHLILGLPGDDLAGFRRTLAFTGRQLERLGPARLPIVTVFWMVVEYGSPFWRDRERLGIRVQTPGVPYALEVAGFPQEDLVEAARAVQAHPFADRFRMDGPRSLIEGVVPRGRMITAPPEG